MRTLNYFLIASICAVHLLSCSTTKPDIVPTDLSFNTNNRLEITFENQDQANIPANTGNLAIFINGKNIGTYSLANLSDQSFRNPNTPYTLETNFRLASSKYRIGVALDTNDEISESNELQNTYSRTLTPPAISGPDFVISDLHLNSSNELNITIKNVGNTSSPTNLPVDIRVIVNETVAADFTPSMPSLVPGQNTTISPNQPVTITGNKEVRVLLNTQQFTDETNNINNTREEILPSGPSFGPYQSLLNNSSIFSNIRWQYSGGISSYNNWSQSQKNDLRNAIIKLENGRSQALDSPPSLSSGRISKADAWKIYIQHIAQTLWIEKNNLVPWSIQTYSNSELQNLLSSKELMVYDSNQDRYAFTTSIMGKVTPWNPRINYRFLKNYDMIKQNHRQTLYAFTNWMRAHLRHWSGNDTLSDLFGYEGFPPADKVLYPLPGKKHMAAGCWGTSGLYAAVLRSVNIPVEHAYTKFGSTNAVHSRPYFPSLDLSMPHADDVYTSSLTPSGNIIPASKLFYTSQEMDNKFLNPQLDCNGTDCNTVGEQASYNSGKEHLEISWQHHADFLLYQYAKYGESYVLGTLRGPRIGGSIKEYVNPYFNASKRQTMVDEIKAYLKILGGGDLSEGKNIVIQRVSKFRENK
ncbi:CARDB domain-containing protein [Fodinibius halophilus]|uniref:CARDB domain-containing protein n=1 Tax=Fodinibius halophilus TaxID=1736908 RepID=A0A6M1TNG2_9BACT|nr:CARDB domain-containing protein [Fodinibius halophilus]NGP89900.1 hypothetical protein [Fodinibius halophilus]